MTAQKTLSELAKIKSELNGNPTATLIAHLLLSTRDFIAKVDADMRIDDFKGMNVDEIIRLAIRGEAA